MLVSTTEYAKLHGKTPHQAKAHAVSGRLKTAIKIGARWAIDDAEPWPEDRRIKNGKWIGFREKFLSPSDDSPADAPDNDG